MNEWMIAFGVTALISLIAACVLANRCLEMYQRIKELEQKKEDLRHSNKALKHQIDALINRIYASPNVEQMTALKLSLHMKQEEIDGLREKIRKQEVLLKQKWEGAKKCG